jgi:Rod binding domain-containing protein
MEVTALQHKVHAADIGVERLANNPRLSEAEKVEEASRQFEAILLRQILSAAHVLSPGVQDQSAANGIYQDMLTNHLANAISHSPRGIGLSDALNRELGRQLNIKDEPIRGKDAVS